MGEVGAGAGPCAAWGDWGLAKQQEGIFQAPVVLWAQSRQVRNKGHVSKCYLLPVVVTGIAQSLTQQAVGHVAGNLCLDRQVRQKTSTMLTEGKFAYLAQVLVGAQACQDLCSIAGVVVLQ